MEESLPAVCPPELAVRELEILLLPQEQALSKLSERSPSLVPGLTDARRPPPCPVPLPPAVADCHLVTLLLYEQLRLAWLG